MLLLLSRHQIRNDATVKSVVGEVTEFKVQGKYLFSCVFIPCFENKQQYHLNKSAAEICHQAMSLLINTGC